MSISTSDRMEILELTARYADALDNADPDGFADTFAADGIMTLDRDAGVIEAHGTDSLRRFILSISKQPKKLKSGRHFNTNHIVEGDGRAATHRCYLRYHSITDEAASSVTGDYQDKLSKATGRWKFTERRIYVDRP